MLHIHNGDSTAGTAKKSDIPGEHLAWREAMVCGPTPPGLSAEEFSRCQTLADLALVEQGVTFSVYSDKRGAEKVMPVCLVPRVIAAEERFRVKGLINVNLLGQNTGIEIDEDQHFLIRIHDKLDAIK